MPFGTKIELSEDEQNALRDLVKILAKEDDEIRKAQIRLWKKYEEYWNGMQTLFWSEQDQSWISPDSVHSNELFNEDEIQQIGPIYDYVVDIYKAHGESIIAALSANIPTLRYRPDDADDETDRLTAQTYSKIADLIYIHNKAKLVMLKALFFAYNFGIIFSYRYAESDPKFGMIKIPKVESQDVLVCPQCGNVREMNELEPCGQCGADVPPTSKSVPSVVGETELPKTRLKVDTFGPLHVKVPVYARDQASCGYLILSTDQNKALLQSIYEDIADEIEQERMESQDRFSRSISSYPHDVIDERMELVTVEKTWLRPWQLYKIPKDKRKSILEKCPRGCQVTFVGKNRIFAEAFNENIDERWEIGQAGLSTYIHSNPIGRSLINLQDMRNELVNLTMDTIDHGCPAVYADSEVLDFDEYGKFESKPGCLYEAKAPKGEPLASKFFAEPRAALSKEHMLFFKQIDQDAQFSSGDFPSIHGGPSEGKSRTLGEYAMSKQMALQRLSIAWELILDWWIRTIDGAVRLFAETVVSDQQYSVKENNNYVNVWIRRTEMEGKVGGVEPESGGAFPVSIVQKRETVLKLIELNNPQINAALYSPQNAKIIRDTLALEDLDIPGEDQRAKQAREINDLVKPDAEPEQIGDMIVPTVQVDPDVDDHQVHIAVIKSYLISTVGLDLKQLQPAQYMNCIGHLKMHQMILQQQMMSLHEETAPGEPPDTDEP